MSGAVLNLPAMIEKPDNWDELSADQKLAWYEGAERSSVTGSGDEADRPPAAAPEQPAVPPAPRHGLLPQTGRRTVRMALLILAVVVVLVLLGVATFFAIKHHRDAVAAREARQAAAAKKAAHEKAIQECTNEIGAFVESLQDLDARLDVGLTQADYADAVGDAAVARAKVNTAVLSTECRSAFAAADAALTTYTKINSEWNECIVDLYCDPDIDVDFSPWTEAGENVDAAVASMTSGKVVDGGSGNGTGT